MPEENEIVRIATGHMESARGVLDAEIARHACSKAAIFAALVRVLRTATLDTRSPPKEWQARVALALLDGVPGSGDGTGGADAVVELILDRISRIWSDLERFYGRSEIELDVALTELAARRGTSRETSAAREAAMRLLCGLRLNGSSGTGILSPPP